MHKSHPSPFWATTYLALVLDVIQQLVALESSVLEDAEQLQW